MPEANTYLPRMHERLGAKILEISHPHGDDVVLLDRAGLRESFRILKEDPELDYDFLSDITAVDYWRKKEPRFELVYQIVCRARLHRLRVRVPVPEALHDLRGLVDELILVPDDAILRAMRLLHRHAAVVAEPSGAAGLAALVRESARFAGQAACWLPPGRTTAPSTDWKWPMSSSRSTGRR